MLKKKIRKSYPSKRKSYNKNATSTLKEWMLSKEHLFRPYPSLLERRELSMKTGLDDKQILNWFVNARKRIWQPLLTAMGKNVGNFILPTGNNGKDSSSLVSNLTNSTLKDNSLDFSLENKNAIANTMKILDSETMEILPIGFSHVSSHELLKTNFHEFPLRRGQWIREEEEYVSALIDAFVKGMLPIRDKVTLRNYLAKRLHCSPMRISKKFVGNAKIGKMLYCSASGKDQDQDQVNHVLENLKKLRDQFHNAVFRESALELVSSNYDKRRNHQVVDIVALQKQTVDRDLDALEARKALSDLLELDENHLGFDSSTFDLSDSNFILSCPFENEDSLNSMDPYEKISDQDDFFESSEHSTTPITSNIGMCLENDVSLDHLFTFQ